MNDIFEINEEYIKNYNVNISRFLSVAKDFSGISNFNDDFKIKLFFKEKDEENFKEYTLNSEYYQDAYLSYKDIEFLENKVLKIELTSLFNIENKYMSSNFEISINRALNYQYPELENLFINNDYGNLTNVSNNKIDIDDENIVLNININNLDLNKFDYEIDLIYSDFENNEKIISSEKIKNNQNNKKFIFNLGKAKDNAGIYYVNLKIKEKTLEKSLNLYSNCVYIVTKDILSEII